MGWSAQAAVVTGGQMQLPVTKQTLSTVPKLYSGSLGVAPNQSAGMGLAGPALAAVPNKASMQLIVWSDTAGGASGASAPGGAHIDIDYFATGGGGVTVAQFDLNGLLLPSVGAPPTPTAGCYIFYNSGILWAKGTSGAAVAIATT